jgi:hypothetical protein
MDDGQTRPVQGLLSKPMLTLLPRVGHVPQAHLRHGHLRHVDEHLDVTLLARRGAHANRCLEIAGRDTHAEVDTPASLQRACNVFGPCKITHKDFRPGPAQSFSALIVTPNESPDRNLPPEQDADDKAPNAANLSRSTCNQDRLSRAHSFSSATVLRFERGRDLVCRIHPSAPMPL